MLWETIKDGGMMMIPLMFFSVLAIGVAIDRGIAFLNYRKVDSRSLRSRLLELVGQGRIDEATQLCADTPGPVSAVLLVGLQSYKKHRPLTDRADDLIDVMEKSMDDYAQHAISAVEKRMSVLSTIGNSAPLLGMTGTVVGMIMAFDELSQTGGFEAGGRVAAGISTALITTAAGLIIALIAVIPYNYFTSLSNGIELEIEEATTELLDYVATRVEGKRSGPSTAAPQA
jgi:biopolymer transport protein ExbB/TolQ